MNEYNCTCGYHAPEQHGPSGCSMLGCDCKWDGRVMAVAPDVAGALAALEAAEKRYGPVGWFHVIRDCLESVAQERADWEAIGAWRKHWAQTAAVVIGVLAESKAMPTSFVGVDHETFAEALSKAARFCRAEMGSKT